jgi:peptide/nickel transport system substrate-binding protein
MRGSRWQVAAFVVSALLFGIVFFLRLSQPTPAPAPTQSPLETPNSESTSAATLDVVLATVAPTDSVPVVVVNVPDDNVPTYREALVGQVQRLNPLLADLNPVDRDITSLIFEGLTRINEFGEPVGALAKSWVVTSDGLEYVFVLREDILWQDGLPFTADDVVYTMGLLSSPDFPGTKEVGAYWRTIETEKMGPYLVRFRLTQAIASFASNLTIGILPEHALRGTTAAQLASHRFNFTPIGTGPYQLEALRSFDGATINQVDLRVAPTFRQRPEGQTGYAISRIRFQMYPEFPAVINALQGGEVDGYANTRTGERATLRGISGLRTFTGIAPTVAVLLMNWNEGDGNRFFQERRVRVALQEAISRAPALDRYLPNEVMLANSPILQTSSVFNPNVAFPVNNALDAIDMLKAANIRTASAPVTNAEGTAQPAPTHDPTTPLYTFSILTWDNPGVTAVAQDIANQWALTNPDNPGTPLLNVSVESLPYDQYIARIDSGTFQAAIVELPLSADPDVYAYWHNGQYPDGRNYAAVADDRLSALLEKARSETNSINRKTLYERFQQEFTERAIAIPLYYPLYTYVVSGRVEGVQLAFMGSPVDRFRTIKDWTLTQ